MSVRANWRRAIGDAQYVFVAVAGGLHLVRVSKREALELARTLSREYEDGWCDAFRLRAIARMLNPAL